MDYIVKPFSPTEFTARVRAALRSRASPEPFVLGKLVIDYDQHPPARLRCSCDACDPVAPDAQLPEFVVVELDQKTVQVKQRPQPFCRNPRPCQGPALETGTEGTNAPEAGREVPVPGISYTNCGDRHVSSFV